MLQFTPNPRRNRAISRPAAFDQTASTGTLSRLRLIAQRYAALPRAFATAREASAAVEFGLIALVSLELLTEAMQAGLYFYTSAGLEHATSKAARQILTGNASNQGLTAAQFRSNMICPALAAVNLSCGNMVSNIQTVSEDVYPNGFYQFVNNTQTTLIRPALDNSKTSYCIGAPGSYVFAQVLYAMPVFSPIWRVYATSFNGAPSFILQSTAAFRNEPFQTGSPSC